MKLYYSNTSPYSRKVRLVIREIGFESDVEELIANPFGEDTQNKRDLISANPLGKIPTLVLSDETALYDSPVICQYLCNLDDSSNTNPLIPIDSGQQLTVMRWEATADGLTDATYNISKERKRSANKQSSACIDMWSSEIKRTLLHIEEHLGEINNSEISSPTLAHLALASAISYLELRFPEGLHDSEMAVAPNTMAWYEEFKSRPTMQATQLIDLKT